MKGAVELRPTISGNDTLAVGGRLVHSSRDPVREALRTVADIVRREPPCVVLLGLGLGYQAEAIVSETDQTIVLAFEPSQEIQAYATSRMNSSLTKRQRKRVTVASTADALDQQLPLLAASGFATLRLAGRFADSPDELSAAETVLNAFATRVEINQNTLSRFGSLWVRNLCRNLPHLAAGVGVASLRNVLSGVPALLLAAGPTLDEVLSELPAIAERMAIVAVDTAVSHARAAGVEPDLAVVVDPQYWNARHLDRVDGTSALLVAETASHPSIYRCFAPPYVFCSSLFPLGIRYEKSIGSFGQLGAGGSVSTTAWDLIRLLGATATYAAGLDLGFPDNRTHCRGSFFESLAVSSSDRFTTAESVVFGYLTGAQPRMVPDYSTGTVLSDARMDIYRRWFVRRIAEERMPTHPLSPHSSKIEGATVVSLETLRSLPIVRPTITERFVQARREWQARHEASDSRPSASRYADRVQALREENTLLTEELDEMARLARTALEKLGKIEADLAGGNAVDFTPLEALDARLSQSGGRAVASFLMQEAIQTIQGGYGSTSIQEQIEASRLVYGSLAESLDYHLLQLAHADVRLGG